MMYVQSKLKQSVSHRRVGVILWVCSWPFVSMLFDSNSHYPTFFKPIGVFSRSSLAPEGYYWSASYFETMVFPATVFWLGLIGVLVFFPDKK